jgi:hypothetical protein
MSLSLGGEGEIRTHCRLAVREERLVVRPGHGWFSLGYLNALAPPDRETWENGVEMSATGFKGGVRRLIGDR